MNNQFDVSVVIICMGKPKYLPACLASIKQYSTVNYETLVVAYMMDPADLQNLRQEYSWVTFIESNEIRGFSANNNLALRQAKGKYCFVLNDDTYFNMPVVDKLFKRAEEHPEIAVITPQIVKPDGKIQYCGMTPIDWKSWLKILFKLKKDNADPKGEWVREEGFFRTYNILGAAFFINTEIFRQLGFLDERFFYGPEDRVLSTKVNEEGHFCYVDSDIKLFHLGGGTAGPKSKTACATRPANRKGWVLYLDKGNPILHYFLCCMVFLNSLIWAFGWFAKRLMGDEHAMISFWANINVCKTIFSSKSTTEIFTKYYKRLKK